MLIEEYLNPQLIHTPWVRVQVRVQHLTAKTVPVAHEASAGVTKFGPCWNAQAPF